MSYSRPSEFLRDLDSHGIYDAAMLDECEFDTSQIPTSSPEQMRSSIEERGLGGHLRADPAARLFSGFAAATALARTFLGSAPGLAFQGRGSSFRTDLAALEEAGH